MAWGSAGAPPGGGMRLMLAVILRLTAGLAMAPMLVVAAMLGMSGRGGEQRAEGDCASRGFIARSAAAAGSARWPSGAGRRRRRR